MAGWKPPADPLLDALEESMRRKDEQAMLDEKLIDFPDKKPGSDADPGE